MNSILKKWPIIWIVGILMVIISNGLMLISFILFPGTFCIYEKTASTLGNVNVNPNGAIFFRLGNILSGILTIPFFLGFFKWYNEEKWTRILLTITIVLGCAMGVAMIMVGVFSQEYRPYHLICAISFFLLSLLSWIFGGLFLLRHPDSIKKIGICSLIIAAAHYTLILYLIYDIIIVECVAIFALSIGILLLVYNFK